MQQTFKNLLTTLKTIQPCRSSQVNSDRKMHSSGAANFSWTTQWHHIPSAHRTLKTSTQFEYPKNVHRYHHVLSLLFISSTSSSTCSPLITFTHCNESFGFSSPGLNVSNIAPIFLILIRIVDILSSSLFCISIHQRHRRTPLFHPVECAQTPESQ